MVDKNDYTLLYLCDEIKEKQRNFQKEWQKYSKDIEELIKKNQENLNIFLNERLEHLNELNKLNKIIEPFLKEMQNNVAFIQKKIIFGSIIISTSIILVGIALFFIK